MTLISSSLHIRELCSEQRQQKDPVRDEGREKTPL